MLDQTPRVLAPFALLLIVAAVACSDDDPPTNITNPPFTGPDAGSSGDAAIASPRCGDGKLDPNEECEGFELRGATCDSLGLAVGTLKCTAECKLDTTGCGGKCGDGVVQPGEDCDGTNLDGKTCGSLVSTTATGTLGCSSDCHFLTDACTEPPATGALTQCTVGAANTCAAPATCVATATGSFCLESCDPAGATAACGTGRYCEDVGGGKGACANVPPAGAGCTTRSGCTTGNSCIPTFLSASGAPISTCAPACPATEVGKGRGSCSAGSSCVAVGDGPVEIEKDTACAVATQSTDCNVAAGYACNTIKDAVGRDILRCTRPYGQCAPVTPLYRFDGSTVPDSMLCDRVRPTRGAAKCGLSSATPLTNPAKVDCVEHFNGTPEVGVCTAFCDGAVMGTSAAGGPLPDGACGDASVCKVPATPEFFLPQSDATAVTCTATTVSTACSAQFNQCVDIGRGLECVRPVKVCVPN